MFGKNSTVQYRVFKNDNQPYKGNGSLYPQQLKIQMSLLGLTCMHFVAGSSSSSRQKQAKDGLKDKPHENYAAKIWPNALRLLQPCAFVKVLGNSTVLTFGT